MTRDEITMVEDAIIAMKVQLRDMKDYAEEDRDYLGTLAINIRLLERMCHLKMEELKARFHFLD